MQHDLKALLVDATTGFYRSLRYDEGIFYGPVDLGLHLSGRHNSLSIGTGLLAGSIFPGSNRLVFTGFSPAWGGFYISSMGGAGLIFDNLGLNLVSIVGRAPSPSLLYLNRMHGEEIEVETHPVDVGRIWRQGRGGVYALMDYAAERFAHRYAGEPRILVVGPAAEATDCGAIASAPSKDGIVSAVDTWAGRGGLGSKLLREHGIAGIVYGGTFVDEDFRDRRVADEWFKHRYHKKLAAQDFEATVKYRLDPKFNTGGTFGVNYATVGGRLLAFNYNTIYMKESERLGIHEKFIRNHYLKQFNDETIATKSQKTCGEPCSAVCKKMRAEFKKDYEPYQTMGPLCGIFDQRAAERLVHHADMYGFDAISIGGVLSWLMECLSRGELKPTELGVAAVPVFSPEGFRVETDSAHNASLGVDLLDAIIERRGLLDFGEGARKLARRLARERGSSILDSFVHTAFARKGWMVPNQYWTPGVLSPMAINGKYYMEYGSTFLPPRELGRKNAERFRAELILDNLGTCRFHRQWAEEMLPEVVEHLFGMKKAFLESIAVTASRINSRNASVFWEPKRNADFIQTFLQRQRDVEEDHSPVLGDWLDRFERDKHEAALEFWFETLKGIQESLREF
ncbi:aldehyde ferredoxin oxidoreductase C-terminal domain-containing protein [Candidatus Eisenbacteria bacterium]|uniref:Aldehyde ferredoxin oxidoreductase C-terminal domain-containing protein n=1 Tax=Eiseniibacteriota bacterium TaxID=2212470 RepID=A0ABV6YIW3_UNCEI